jgi:hypothetical protein
MKASYTLFILTFFVLSVGCEKKNSPDAEDYVSLLKSNQYDSFNMPDLEKSDIPTLLKYVNSTTPITKFPRNSSSSHMQQECNLGMVVLWTIESIRALETGSDRLIGKFPSQNSFLQLRNEPYDWLFDNESQSIAARAYKNWWNSIHFKDKMKIDPLEMTPFIWH